MLTSEQIIGQVKRSYNREENTHDDESIKCKWRKFNLCQYNHSPVLLFARLSCSSQRQYYKLGNITCFALMTPRLFFLPTTMASAPACTFSTSARGTRSPVRERTTASSSMRIATGFVSPVCCFTAWPAMTYLCLFPGAITTPVIVTLYPFSRSVLTRSSEA